jgi:hypothetical protein
MARKPSKPEQGADENTEVTTPDVSEASVPSTPALPPKDEVFGLKRVNH